MLSRNADRKRHTPTCFEDELVAGSKMYSAADMRIANKSYFVLFSLVPDISPSLPVSLFLSSSHVERYQQKLQETVSFRLSIMNVFCAVA